MDGKVFVSYARTDSDFALRLAQDLRAASVSVWMDQMDISPGDPWDRAVEAALRECQGVLVILSPHAVASRSVMDEESFALDEEKRVLPVICESCEVPFRLRRLQHADCASSYSAGLARIIQALGGVAPLGTPQGTGESAKVTEVPAPHRRRCRGSAQGEISRTPSALLAVNPAALANGALGWIGGWRL